MRFILYRCLQAPITALTDILDANADTLPPYSPYKRENIGRTFEVLYDKVWSLGNNCNSYWFKKTFNNVGTIHYTGVNLQDSDRGMINSCWVTDVDSGSTPPRVWGSCIATITDI